MLYMACTPESIETLFVGSMGISAPRAGSPALGNPPGDTGVAPGAVGMSAGVSDMVDFCTSLYRRHV